MLGGPALFTTGFSSRAGQLPRVFAMLELLRGSAAFPAGPIILHLAATTGGSAAGGIQISVWVCFVIATAGAIVSLYVFILGRGRLQVPDIAKSEQTGEPACDSPELAAGIRTRKPDGHAAGLSEYRGVPWHRLTRKADRAEIIRLSGAAEVPILVLDDGSVISDSHRIVRWAHEHPAARQPIHQLRDRSSLPSTPRHRPAALAAAPLEDRQSVEHA